MNLKLLIVFAFVKTICFSAIAQTKVTLNYRFTMNSDKMLKTNVDYVVYFDGKASIEKSIINNSIKDNLIDESTEVKVIKTERGNYIYKDFANNKMILSDRIQMTQYLINDTLNNFKWKMSKEKKKIQNYLCTKATTYFRGRNYEAWYAEDIPIQNGPWKFCGLPGLIVKVRDNENKFVYELTGINLKAKFDEKIIDIPKEYTKDKPISHKQFMILYKKKIEDYAKLSKVVHVGKNGGTGSVTIILPEKMEKY